ncbi:MAG: hypothetical protein AB9869_08115 [Verrucomicrobiia bacterium]
MRPGPGQQTLPAPFPVSQDQAVVDDLSQVIRKHRDKDPARLARLVTYAFDLTLETRPTRGDKLARALTRGIEAKRELAEAEGGSLSSDEVARLLNISKTAVLKRLAAGRLLAWREERLNAARFPAWQFATDGRVLQGLEEVLDVLHQDPQLGGWGKVLFFLQTRAPLGNKRPLDLLREGDVKRVCSAAQAYVE